jgi:cell wall-associated NlpC family hydrolase
MRESSTISTRGFAAIAINVGVVMHKLGSRVAASITQVTTFDSPVRFTYIANVLAMTHTNMKKNIAPLRWQIYAAACGLAAGLCLATPVTLADAAPAERAPTFGRLEDLTSRASELVLGAMSMIGIRYKYGGTEPESGLDCSGLVRYVFKEVLGKELPRTSEEISRVGQQIDTKDLRPGDLVFYNTLRRGFSHVGIYLGDNKFIHSPSAGGQVRIESMDIGYWKQRFNGARRIDAQEQK